MNVHSKRTVVGDLYVTVRLRGVGESDSNNEPHKIRLT